MPWSIQPAAPEEKWHAGLWRGMGCLLLSARAGARLFGAKSGWWGFRCTAAILALVLSSSEGSFLTRSGGSPLHQVRREQALQAARGWGILGLAVATAGA